MRQFTNLELEQLFSTFKDIFLTVVKEGDEQILYEINFALEFRPDGGKAHGRGVVTFGLSGVGEPNCYSFLLGQHD